MQGEEVKVHPLSLYLPQRQKEDDGKEQACQWNCHSNVTDNPQTTWAVHLVEELRQDVSLFCSIIIITPNGSNTLAQEGAVPPIPAQHADKMLWTYGVRNGVLRERSENYVTIVWYLEYNNKTSVKNF